MHIRFFHARNVQVWRLVSLCEVIGSFCRAWGQVHQTGGESWEKADQRAESVKAEEDIDRIERPVLPEGSLEPEIFTEEELEEWLAQNPAVLEYEEANDDAPIMYASDSYWKKFTSTAYHDRLSPAEQRLFDRLEAASMVVAESAENYEAARVE